MSTIRSESELIAVARALAGSKTRFFKSERALFADAPPVDGELLHCIKDLIAAGADPLGEAFCQLRSAMARRMDGAIYTPPTIVRSMIHWAAAHGTPARIVDPGCGSGRFLLAAAKRFPTASLVAVDTDPLATLMLRANASCLGVQDRLSIHHEDYRQLALPAVGGPTLFIGNPPYVRHHDIGRTGKAWFAEAAAELGVKASKLAGLHVHFFLKTRQLGRPGDYGAFITSSEWLDVNYGAVLRHMLTDGLGGAALHVLAPESMPFANAAATGAITCFFIGRRPSTIVMRSVDSPDLLENLDAGRRVPWSKLLSTSRWSTLVKPSSRAPAGYMELGELCRVHRGQVTGSNSTWIAGAYPGELPDAILFPTVTKARELLAAAPILASAADLRRIIDVPADLNQLDPYARKLIDRFLHWARTRGAHESYIAANRRPWWSVKLRAPAPILCTYMARRPPAFVRNLCGARHINIAHGLYPREPLSEADLMALIAYLSREVCTGSGRTYAGGLTKFEPKELERVPIPRLEKLHDIADQMDDAATAGGRRKGESRLST